jgi:hypothetical protein
MALSSSCRGIIPFPFFFVVKTTFLVIKLYSLVASSWLFKLFLFNKSVKSIAQGIRRLVKNRARIIERFSIVNDKVKVFLILKRGTLNCDIVL